MSGYRVGSFAFWARSVLDSCIILQVHGNYAWSVNGV